MIKNKVLRPTPVSSPPKFGLGPPFILSTLGTPYEDEGDVGRPSFNLELGPSGRADS